MKQTCPNCGIERNGPDELYKKISQAIGLAVKEWNISYCEAIGVLRLIEADLLDLAVEDD